MKTNPVCMFIKRKEETYKQRDQERNPKENKEI